MKISRPAYAKINLMLSVGARRDDGYHNIESVMQTVSLHDTVTLKVTPSKNPTGNIKVMCSIPELSGENNLAYRAVSAYQNECNIKNYDISVEIIKRIPVAAGLAGGSADCAAVLRALNAAFGNLLTHEKLCRLGASLGADVTFCLYGGTCIARGIGDIITPCSPLTGVYILIVETYGKISTGEAYSRLDAHPDIITRDNKAGADMMLTALAANDMSAVAAVAYNDFELINSYGSSTDDIKRIIYDSGALLAMMSGSGPSVFGLFTDITSARRAYRRLRAKSYVSHICTAIDTYK